MAKKKQLTKEQVYDAEINPLMAQIIEICNRKKIANVCTFSLDDDLLCTTAMTGDEYCPPDKYKEIVRILYPPQRPMMMVATRDGNGNVTRMDAIV